MHHANKNRELEHSCDTKAFCRHIKWDRGVASHTQTHLHVPHWGARAAGGELPAKECKIFERGRDTFHSFPYRVGEPIQVQL